MQLNPDVRMKKIHGRHSSDAPQCPFIQTTRTTAVKACHVIFIISYFEILHKCISKPWNICFKLISKQRRNIYHLNKKN